MSSPGIIALTPSIAVSTGELEPTAVAANNCEFSLADAAIALAACRAGAIGIVNLEFAGAISTAADERIAQVIAQLHETAGAKNSGIKFDITQIAELQKTLKCLSQFGDKDEPFAAPIILSLGGGNRNSRELKKAIEKLHALRLRVIVEAVSVQEAQMAQTCGADAVIAKGHEAAGRVGEQTTFVLLQQCIKALKIQVWAEGGIGLHTAAACHVAGAAGVVLNSQLFLTPESNIALPVKQKFAAMDGTETMLLGGEQIGMFRMFARHDAGSPGSDKDGATTRDAMIARLNQPASVKPLDRTWVVGQDIAFAADLTRRYSNVAGIIHAIEDSIAEHTSLAVKHKPLATAAPMAVSHGTKFSLVQGAMTRVSDTAEFALKVSEGGALPFLALALMRGSEVDTLLAQTKEKLGHLPWGVGILGFVPHQLRQEQMDVIRKYNPPFALIAGGRPDQAKALEEIGTKTYLHVPSPMLLESFIEMGSKRFIFEGKECGGHVGPRSSFVLWEAMVEKLLGAIGPKDDAAAFHVLFAGGVHDGLSAAMVSALAAPLAARGVKVGALMGTAYLFTREAVETGAIVKKFQEAAVQCQETVLLETGPGHAIRCIQSPYKRTFDHRRNELVLQKKSRDEVREELELMNLGRLRIASKGLARTSKVDRQSVIAEFASAPDAAAKKDTLEQVSDEEQWADGMYMIGQIAAMHDKVCTIEELHTQVADGSCEILNRCEKESALRVSVTTDSAKQKPGEPVAIVGMSCLFPKATNVEAYWQNILNKVDTITEVPIEHWDWRNYYDKDPLARDKIYSKWGGFLEDIKFDATRYGIPPSSLSSIDPMQLLLLEVTRSALADAGYTERSFERQKTSVIVANAGHGPITAFFSLRSMLGWKLAHLDESIRKDIEEDLPEWTEDVFPGYLGNVVAGRVANRFDLGGVNFTVDAACGSSLAALYVAMSELRHHNSDVVLLGATDTHNQPGDYLSFSKTHAFSAQGRCRTFDATADGIVISEGMAMLVLKRLVDAERDGDRIYAVLKGIGGSSDGRDLSLTAPRPAGQVLALSRAYEDACISPASVTLVEAHGTGTVAGDKAEIEALKQVYEKAGSGKQACAVGSVKTMIGHTKCAAGLASIIKVAKALHHKVLPPTIGVTTPNPACNFETSPFYINSETRPWINLAAGSNSDAGTQLPRRAAVSAFGFGGTNFHTVVEEYIAPTRNESPAGTVRWPAELFILRARTRTELLRSAESLAETAKKWSKAHDTDQHDALRLVSYNNYLKQLERAADSHDSKNTSRVSEPVSLAIVASSLDDLLEKLEKSKQDLQEESGRVEIKDPRGIYFTDLNDETKAKTAQGKVAFLFSGQGSQHVDMLRDVAMQFKEVRDSLEASNSVLRTKLNKPLTNYIYPPPAFSPEEKKRQQNELTDTQVAQPAVGAADMAMLKLLSSFGVKADMVAGHSYGEYAALCAAGAISEADLLRISEIRGRLLSYTNGDGRGSMAAFTCGVSLAQKILEHCPGVTLANINSPNQCVVSGEAGKIQTAIETAKKAGVQAREIAVSQAFHSKHMAHSQAPLKAALSEIAWSPPTIAVYANTDATVYPSSAAEIVARLTEHIVLPVDFVGEIKQMHKDGATVFVEVGPGCVLAGLADSILQESKAPSVVLCTDRAGRNGIVQLLHTLAQLAALGQALDLERLFAGRISTSDCLSLKTTPAPEPSSKKGLTYLVNSHRIKRVGAPETAKPAATATQAPKAATQTKPTGAQVSAHSKPTTPQAAPASNTRVSAEPPPQAQAAKTPSLPPAGVASSLLNAAANTPATAPSPNAAGLRNVDQVMLQFQQSMLQMTNSFLETQQQVMLAYLNGGNGVASSANNYQNTCAEYIDTNNGAQHTLAMMQKAIESAPSPAGAIDFAPARNDQPAAGASTAYHYEQSGNGNGHENSNGNGGGNGKSGHDVETAARIEATTTTASDPEQLIASLLEIVSERTGYPPEMLDPTLDLEADLGIDSIKRVEILNSFRKILPEAKQLELESGIEELAGTKTLQGIMNWIRSDGARTSPVSSAAPVPADTNGKNGNGHHSSANDFIPTAKVMLTPTEPARKNGAGHTEDSITSILSRATVEAIELPPVAVQERPLAPGIIVIVDDEQGVGEALVPRLESMGQSIVRICHRPGATASTEHSADLTDETQIKGLIEQLHAKHGAVAGVIHLLALNSKFADTLQPLYTLFQLCRTLEHDLNRKDEQTLIVAAHQLDGKFGCDNAAQKPVQAGLAGLVKSLGKEWSSARCKSIDLGAGGDAQSISLAIAGELSHAEPRTEIGLHADKRYGLQVVNRPIAQSKEKSQIHLDSNSVVVITGGARGITAEIAAELAALHQPKLILVGRSEKPSEESTVTAHLQSAKEIKSALIEQLKREQKPVSIAAVETVYQKLMRDREIAANIWRLEELGATVEYHAVDVRDVKQFSQLIESIYERHGRIDGVIHGAGIIEDAYVKDKTLESFRRVVETKVTSAQILARALRLDSLQFLFFFSSVVGRTGNAGQTDYVSANEILNKMAMTLNAKTNARVASLMWGPWRGGMAQSDLEAIFARYGWAMIDPATGRQSFMRELEFGRKQDVEVLLVAEVALQPEKRGARLFDAESTSIAPGKTLFTTTLDTETDIYLNHHTFDGVPVMPMAMAVELMMEAAQSSFPGWKATSVTAFDIPSGIVFERSSKVLTVKAEIISRSDSDITVATALGIGSPMKRVNFKAKVQLVREGTEYGAGRQAPAGIAMQIDPEQEIQRIEAPVASPPTVQQIYDEWFFHGPLFQGIKKISAVGSSAVFGEIAPSDPAKCLKHTNGDAWILDPILLDSAMQVGGVWARHFLEITALPTGFRQLHKFSDPSPENLYVRALLYPINANELSCDIAVYNADGSLCFVMKGLGGVGSKSLNRLAQVNQAASGQAPSGSTR
jgi:acyl transferase domain-containing protein/NAD(P)H-dependent flavin oxidoreductase YrpB (nitropropane dioxygenase family)